MTRIRLQRIFTRALTRAAIDTLPPILVEGAGHGLVRLGRGLQHAGRVIEHVGSRTVEYGDAQRRRNTQVFGARGMTRHPPPYRPSFPEDQPIAHSGPHERRH